METGAGTALCERLGEGRMPLGEAIAMLDSLCEVVGKGHRQGVTHGALQPSLVSWDGTRARVGAATTPDPAYLSPQQLAFNPSDPCADVFALGIIGYRSITGLDPFGDTAADPRARLAAMEQGAADPREVLPKLNDTVARTLLVALERNLTERFADALTMRAALRGDSVVALETPTLKWAVKQGAPPGEVTPAMAAFLSDAPAEGEEPDAVDPQEPVE